MKTRVALVGVALLSACICISAVAQTRIKVVEPSHDVVVPSRMLQKLSAADTEAFAVLASGGAVVVYDTVRDKPGTADFMDNHPHVVVFSPDGAVALDIDSVALVPVGPVRFDSLAIMPASSGAPVLVCAFTLGVDGSGTFFAFIGRQSEGYKVVATLYGAQAQLRFSARSPNRLEFWTADGSVSPNDLNKNCVWCPKYYRTKTYQWRDGKLLLLAARKSSRGYEPETFDDARFLVK